MNNKHIEKLWRMADKLRGAFEISDLYKIMLEGLLIKYAECEKEILETYDEKYSLGYLSLTYGKITRPYDLFEYLRKLEYEFRVDSGVISESFDQVLSKADMENVRIIFEGLNELQIDSKEDCYHLAQSIVSRMAMTGGKFLGMIGTNMALAKLEAALLDVQDNMTVYDAYCGTGISANEVASGKGIVFMQDSNISSIGIAAVMTLFSGNKVGAIRCADSIHNPIDREKKYDRVVFEPPFGMKYEKYYLETIGPDYCVYHDIVDADTLPLRHAISSLTDEGIATVLVPMGILFKAGRVGEVRERLVQDGYIDAIIELPSGAVTGTGVATALVVLKKDKKNTDLLMINAKDYCSKAERGTVTITDENIQRIVTIYRNRETIEGVANTIAKEEAANNSYNLCTTQYVMLKATEGITVEDNSVYMNNYEKLLQKLGAIDKELDSVRSRFVKEA